MANRRMYQFAGNNVAGVSRIFAKVAVGASGAPTLTTSGVSGNNSYITSITRNSAGDYTIALADAWNALLDIVVRFQSATGIPAAPAVGIKTNAVTTKSLGFVCSTGGVATDPANGETMFIHITLKNSSI